MTNYKIKLARPRKGVIPLGLVAEVMAQDDATQGDPPTFHRPTFDNMRRERASDLLAAARSGKLVVCNSTGAENAADAIVLAARSSIEPFTDEQLAYFEREDTQFEMFYTTAKRLNEWRENTGETFSVKVLASKIVNVGNGRIRGEVPLDDEVTGTEVNEPGKKHLYKQRHQEEEILRVIRELGYVPLALPRMKPGTKTVKFDVRLHLNFSVKVFDKAWERLRAKGEIKEKQ